MLLSKLLFIFSEIFKKIFNIITQAFIFIKERKKKDALRRDLGGLADGPEGATTSATMHLH